MQLNRDQTSENDWVGKSKQSFFWSKHETILFSYWPICQHMFLQKKFITQFQRKIYL